MKKELQEELFNKYPKLFKQKDDDMTKTCLCWGVECGDGWYYIINLLCFHIQNICDTGERKYIYRPKIIRYLSKIFKNPKLYGYWKTKEISQVEFIQIKEKFGTLRIYYSGGNNTIDELISYAENLSGTICETCGSNKGVTQTTGWIKTLCEDCLKKEKS